MHAVKQLITFLMSWLLIKESWCLFQGGKAVKSPFKVLKGPFGLKQCIKECLLQKRCQTFGYHRVQLRCELGGSEDVKDVSDSDYKMAFRTDLFEYQQLLGKCANHSCDAGEKCVVTKSGQLKCVISDCDTNTGYSMINSGDDFVCQKVYNIGTKAAFYEMSVSRCQEDGGRLMIMDKAWKINATINFLNRGKAYFINGFKNEFGTWIFSDGSEFVQIASVEYVFKADAVHLSMKKERKILYDLGKAARQGFICEM